ncbi:hypothetical protein H4I96_06307 [Botrytis cinerea]
MLPVRRLSRRQDGPSNNELSSPTAEPNHSSTATTATPSGQSQSDSSTRPTYIIAITVTLFGLILLLLALYIIRRTRIKHKNPKYIPTVFLKKAWESWDPEAHQYRLPGHNDPHEYTGAAGVSGAGRNLSSRPPPSFNAAARTTVENVANNDAAGVDRNTSVRSVMTLPAYNMTPGQNEQVLGREGDRGGIDVVLEFPETIDEEESQREAEMEALYQVRLARRRENEEREERRRLRREARERGDHVALRELQSRPANTSTGPTVEELRAEHERIKKERQRAVSSVAYGDLGSRDMTVHDYAQTVMRANDKDCLAMQLVWPRVAVIIGEIAAQVQSRADSRPESPLRRSIGPGDSNDNHEDRAGSSPEMIDHDDVPLSSPPGYENVSLDTPHEEASALPHHMTEPPPDYTSPIYGRGEGPSLESTGSRRSQNLDGVMTERRTSTHSTNSGLFPRDERRTSTRSTRGVGGIPQLPSLRLGSLPSIHVDPGSPMTMGTTEEEGHSPHSQTHFG